MTSAAELGLVAPEAKPVDPSTVAPRLGLVAPQQASKPEPGLGDFFAQQWDELKRFGSGVARGSASGQMPTGRASETPGGAPGLGGEMLGAGARSVAEGLWEAIKTPGQYLTGEKHPGPQSPAEALGPAMLMAGQGARFPKVLPRPAAVPEKPLLALPPPTVQIPGSPPVTTGVGPKEFGDIATQLMARGGSDPMLRSAMERLPQPGLLPRGPASEMTSPAATPLMGQPGRPTAPAPSSPMAEVTTSPLSQAIVGNDSGAIDRTLTNSYRRTVQPKKLTTEPTLTGLDAQDRRIMTTFDQIIAEKPNLRLTDGSGHEVNGQLPRSLRQFAEATAQQKKNIFEQYDQMAQQAGQGGVQVPLAPAIRALRQAAETPQVADLNPAVAAAGRELADTMEARGFYSPSEAQDVIQNINRTLAGFWQRGGDKATASQSAIWAPVAQILRDELDKAISANVAPGYQALRFRYQALRTVEKDLANALQKHANKVPGGIAGGLADLAASEQLLHGVLTLNPERVATAAGIYGAKRLLRMVNDPNRAIARMFARREGMVSPATGRAYTPQPYNRGLGLATGAGASAIQRGSDNPPPTLRRIGEEPRHSVGAE